MRELPERIGPEALKRSLHDDESGMALLYLTIALPAIIGVALLAVDVGRFLTLNSSLAHGADALALAGAAELDGTSNAIERAESAMNLFVTDNKALFSSSVADITLADVDRCYLTSLPASDATAINPADCLSTAAGNLSTSSARARFVQVKVRPKSYTTVFPATFLGALTNSNITEAEAVAGFTAVACNFTPMFMCNPYEPDNALVNDPSNIKNPYGIYDYVKSATDRRRQIAFKSQSKQWGPGNFGFLAVNGSGAPGLVTQILQDTPNACFEVNDLDTQTGNLQSLSDAFNVRFDLFPNGALPGGEKPKDYKPAPNVRKGYYPEPQKGQGGGQGNVDYCSVIADVSPYSKAWGPGLDTCFTSASPSTDCFTAPGSSTANDRIGKGDWDYSGYWANNHGGTAPTFSTSPPSRYEVYKYEIDNSRLGKAVNGTEYGQPMCQTTASSLGADRRIIYGAIINCRAADVGGKTKDLQAVAFGKFFMTNPMSKQAVTDPDTGITSDRFTLYTELIDVVRPGDGTGVARDRVQLYR